MLFPIAISSNARNVDPDRGMMPAPSFNYAPKQKREGFLKLWVEKEEEEPRGK